MKKYLCALAAFAFTLSLGHGALAFSVDRTSGVNQDGSVKYADPDEQQPGFVLSPDNGENGEVHLLSPQSSVNTPAIQDNDGGAAAFNRAFDHQQTHK